MKLSLDGVVILVGNKVTRHRNQILTREDDDGQGDSESIRC